MDLKQQRVSYQRGTVVLDRRRMVWYFRWREDGIRKSKRVGTLDDLPTKAEAKRAAAAHATSVNKSEVDDAAIAEVITLGALVQRYRAERLPVRFSTRSAYQYNLKNHILPRWGAVPIREVKPYAVELWLRSLSLSAKSRVHLRGLMRILFDLAMLWEYLPCDRNPMELVKIEGASKRTQEPKILTVDEFHSVLEHLDREPLRTMVLTAMCLGLRVSELLALKWKDVDWNHLRIRMWASPAMAGDKPLFYTHPKFSISYKLPQSISSYRIGVAPAHMNDAYEEGLGSRTVCCKRLEADDKPTAGYRPSDFPLALAFRLANQRTFMSAVDFFFAAALIGRRAAVFLGVGRLTQTDESSVFTPFPCEYPEKDCARISHPDRVCNVQR